MREWMETQMKALREKDEAPRHRIPWYWCATALHFVTYDANLIKHSDPETGEWLVSCFGCYHGKGYTVDNVGNPVWVRAMKGYGTSELDYLPTRKKLGEFHLDEIIAERGIRNA